MKDLNYKILGRHLIGIVLLLLSFLVISCNKKTRTLVKDDFKEGVNDWGIYGDAKGEEDKPLYSADSGVVDGYISAKDDVTGGVWYFDGPEAYLGEKEEFYESTLKFSLFQDSKLTNQFDEEDVIIKREDKKIYHRIAPFPDTSWTHYEIPIKANAGWRIANRKEATEEEIKEILDSITAFRIRGEYEGGPDTGGLDEIKIVK